MAHIDEAAKFLLDNGLLFEINRKVLHPLGLALEIQMEDDGSNVTFGRIWDERKDQEGIIFAEDSLEDGANKLHGYMHQQGIVALAHRQEKLGYIIQALPEKYQDG